MTVDRLADHVGSLVAVVGRTEHLQLEICFAIGPFTTEMRQRGTHDVVDITIEVGKGP
jgi:hypothetical protein